MNDAWNRFAHTGAVQDYLDYVSQSRNAEGVEERAFATHVPSLRTSSGVARGSGEYKGKVESTHGSIDESNRDRTFF